MACAQSVPTSAPASEWAATAAAPMCSLTANQLAAINYKPVRSACDASQLPVQDLQAFCSSCVCAVGVANLLGFEAAGVLLQGQRVSQLAAADYPTAVGAVSSLANTCRAVLGSKLLESGALSPQALADLGRCSLDVASLQCAEPDWAAAAAISVTRRGVPSTTQAAAAASAVQAALVAAVAVLIVV